MQRLVPFYKQSFRQKSSSYGIGKLPFKEKLYIHASFLNSGNLYSTSSRDLLRGALSQPQQYKTAACRRKGYWSLASSRI